MLVLTILITLVLLGVGLALVSKKITDETDRFGTAMLSVALFAAAFGTLVGNSFTIVEPGHRGVQVTLGTMNMDPLPEGWQIVNPFSDVDEYTIQTQKTTVTYNSASADTQEVTVKFIFNWRADPSRITYLVKDNTKDFADVLFDAAATESVKAEVAKHKVSEILDKREEIKIAIQERITTWLGEYGVIVTKASIADIDFSHRYNDAIEAKQVQEQKAEEEKNILKQKTVIAEQAKAEAKGKADAAIEKARGEAAALIAVAAAKATAITSIATAQAEANDKIRASLDEVILRRMWLETWDGKLPHFLSSGDAGLSLILPASVGTAK